MADYLDAARYRAGMYGYTLVLRTSFNDPDDEIPGNPLGWTDHSTKRCYVFTDKFSIFSAIMRPRAICKVALHEVGHARWKARSASRNMVTYWRDVRDASLGTAQQVEEDYCEAYSYYIFTRTNIWGLTPVQAGVSYAFRSPVPSVSRIMNILGPAL